MHCRYTASRVYCPFSPLPPLQVHVQQPFVCVQASGMVASVQGLLEAPSDSDALMGEFRSEPAVAEAVMQSLGMECVGSYTAFSSCNQSFTYQAACQAPATPPSLSPSPSE